MKSFSNDLPNTDKDQINRIEQTVVEHLERAQKYLHIHIAVSAVLALIGIVTFVTLLLKH